MKKFGKIIFVFALMFMLFGCKENQEAKEKENQVGTIELESNPTTGYQWIYEIEDSSIIAVTNEEYISDEENDELVGVGGIQKYEITGLQEGSTNIVFKYKRSWEDEEIEVKKYIINVDNKFNVLVEES